MTRFYAVHGIAICVGIWLATLLFALEPGLSPIVVSSLATFVILVAAVIFEERQHERGRR